MKWILRIIALFFFVFGLLNFSYIEEINISLKAGLWGSAIGGLIGRIFIWWLIAWLCLRRSCNKKHQK